MINNENNVFINNNISSLKFKKNKKGKIKLFYLKIIKNKYIIFFFKLDDNQNNRINYILFNIINSIKFHYYKENKEISFNSYNNCFFIVL
jgi:hypothetical protein